MSPYCFLSHAARPDRPVSGISLEELVGYLDGYLGVAEVADFPGALNGLQVQNSGRVGKIVAAVDACQATIDATAESGAGLLLVHHGLFWGGAGPVTGRQWRRLSRLLAHDVAVYSAHLPLDCHPEVGNNALLGVELGLRETERFGEYHGTAIGVMGEIVSTRDALVARLAEILGATPHVMPGGPVEIRRVGIVTGGAGSMIDEARIAGVDTFVTGEGAHHTHFDAEEGGINVIYGGHYATETFGVKALAQHLETKFGVPWEFVDHPTGL